MKVGDLVLSKIVGDRGLVLAVGSDGTDLVEGNLYPPTYVKVHWFSTERKSKVIWTSLTLIELISEVPDESR